MTIKSTHINNKNRSSQIMKYIILLLSLFIVNNAFAITRAEIMTTARSYADHTWNCSADNADATYNDYSVGAQTGVAYTWGGWDTVTEFQNKIDNNAVAGNACHISGTHALCVLPAWATGNWCVFPSFAGVDCSGFVQRCWNITDEKHNTTMLGGHSDLLASWNDLQQGDILLSGTHVQLVESFHSATGVVIIYDSSIAVDPDDIDFVERRSVPRSATVYTPRRYESIEGPTCATLGTVLITTDQPSYTYGETVTGDIVVTNNSGAQMDIDAIGNIYDETGALIHQRTMPTSVTMETGMNTLDLSELFGIIFIDSTTYSTGDYTMEVEVTSSADACTWIVTTNFTVDIRFQKTFGPGFYGKAAQQTADGGYIIMGDNSPSLNRYSPVPSDLHLVKTDAFGNQQWANTIGGPDTNVVYYSMEQTSDGGYIALGSSMQETIYGSEYPFEMYLLKVDSSGNQQWEQHFGGPPTCYTVGMNGTTSGNEVHQTADGGYILFGDTNIFSDTCDNEMYMVKTDSAGNKQWDKTFVGPEYSHYLGWSGQQTFDAQGNPTGYIMLGWDQDNGWYLIKTDSSGNLVWDKIFSGGFWRVQVRQTADGGYILTLDNSSNGHLVKTDSDGNTVWDKNDITGGGYHDVRQTADGGYVIAGSTYSGSNAQQMHLLKTDSDGNEEWEKLFGGTGSDYGHSVNLTDDGGYILGGINGSYGGGGMYLVKTDANGNSYLNTYYYDADGDSYGDPLDSVIVDIPPGYVADNTDCNDGDPAINRGVTEVCDGIDNNCDGNIDEGGVCGGCNDADGDTYDDVACGGNDCDDSDPAINPAATEVCDGVDNNCDGNIDEGGVCGSCNDADSDTYDDDACGGNDCDDSNPAINPAAAEVPDDGLDNNCDGLFAKTYYQDSDGDTYGNPSVSQVATSQPAGYVSDNTDCNDGDPAINPGATEVCDGVDNNCDTVVDEGCSACNETINVDRFKIDCGKEKIEVKATSDTQPDAQPLTFIIYDGSGVQQFPSSGAESMTWKASKNRYEYKQENLGDLSSWDDNYYVIVYSQDCPSAESSQHIIDDRKNCP